MAASDASVATDASAATRRSRGSRAPSASRSARSNATERLRSRLSALEDQLEAERAARLRAEDALAIIEDQSYRGAFGELVFKDVIFRTQGPYLSKHYRTSIDTAVVAGADTQALVGKFKKESTGPKPMRESKKIWSVVIPCYTQDGVTIRPATVRVGAYF